MNPAPEPRAGILLGPTASGKTALAVALAKRLPIEVVSADSRQVYRRLDIGTAKPTAEERRAVAHHLIDLIDIEETYNAARFAADALARAADIRARRRIPLVVGGAGFYLRVLEEGLFEPPYAASELQAVRRELESWSNDELRTALVERDPLRAEAIHPNDRYRLSRALEICIASGRSVTALTAEHPRPERHFLRFRLCIERRDLHARIEARTHAILEAGWLDEVRTLLDAGIDTELPGLATLGYPHVIAHLAGRIDRARLVELVVRDTRRFARSQETWFRKTRDATSITWNDSRAVDVLVRELTAAFPGARP
jgi:tRNA dimethylallyltransferase